MGAISISPPNPSLTVIDATIPSVPFTATLNGVDVTNSVTWLYDKPEIGDINTSSTFLPTGNVGGVGKLTAKYNGAEGWTNVTVYVKKTIKNGVPQPQIDLLDAPNGGPDTGLNVAYPYPQTVFPLGVLSPEIQWFGGQPNDIYKIKLTEKYFEYTEYFATTPPGRHIIPQLNWDGLSSSGTGSESDPVTFSINRLTNLTTAYDPQLATWHIAQGKLKGVVYYWELPDQCGNGNGRILRIKADSEMADEFYYPGGCWGCHTVSRDGKRMMATLETGSPFPQVTVNLTTDPAQQGEIGPGALGGTFSAYNDKSDKILVSNDGLGSQERLRIVDANTGAVLNDNAMGNDCGEPAWSPNGKKIAGICGMSGGSWMFDSYTGNLTVADVADDGTTVSNVTTLVAQGAPGRPAYPSFAPGNEWLAFGRPYQGAMDFSPPGSRTTSSGDLWLVGLDGSLPRKLEIASTDGDLSPDNRAFNPVFAPLRAGGYFWLVFISRRDYGNRLQGANRQQLWITAIDDPPTAADPSHPPFYIRGQEDCAKSENAYYALEPCKEVGAPCTSGVDCCNGQCVKDAQTGMYVCGDPPPPGECSQDGNSCENDADCCNFNPSDPDSSHCTDGFCEPPPPK